MSNDEAERYWAKLVGQANVSLSGASDAEIRVQLFDTLEEFFDGSNCWQEAISVPVVADLQDYPIFPQSGRILRLYDVLDQNGTPQAVVMPVPGQLHFLYPFSNPQLMTAIVVKNVTDPFLCFPPNIPDWILPMHGRGILNGLLGSMMAQPGQSYSNPRMANFCLMRFRDAISHARVAMAKMNKVGAQTWVFPQQFRVGGQKGGVSTFNVHPTAVLR